jgi:hypothetical protein
MPSPILISQQYENEKALSLKKLPPSGLYGNGMIYSYNQQDELVFLYSNGKTDAIKYNIKKDMHRKIKSSNTPDIRGITTLGPGLSAFLFSTWTLLLLVAFSQNFLKCLHFTLLFAALYDFFKESI